MRQILQILLLPVIGFFGQSAFTGILDKPFFAGIPDKPYYVGISYGAGQIYSGLKYHVDGTANNSSPQNYNARISKASSTLINGGFTFTKHWAFEAQYMITGVLDMPFFVGNEKVFDQAKLSAQAYGFYGVYKAGSDVYVRARLGLGQSFINLSGKEVSANYSGFGLTYGLSVGKKLGKLGAFELTYMRYADVKASGGKACVPVEANASGSVGCVPDDGAKRYFSFNQKMRVSAFTVGYVFIF